MISVAAELAEMHPQTLRMYEARGLIEPKRSPKGTRLYSHADVERLRRIQELTSDAGMNLAGVEKVFELEAALERMQRKVGLLERRAVELQGEIARLEEVKRSVKAEIVRYEAVSTDLVPLRVPAPLARRLERQRQRLCARDGRARRRPAATARRLRRGNRKPRRRSRCVRGAAGACGRRFAEVASSCAIWGSKSISASWG